MKTLPTHMFPVLYRHPATLVDPSQPGKSELINIADTPELYWLDELLGGGLALPDGIWPTNKKQELQDPNSTFVILLLGPPGSGKSCFAMQLCLGLANRPGLTEAPVTAHKWTSVYCSLEMSAERIIENAVSLGFVSTEEKSGILTEGHLPSENHPASGGATKDSTFKIDTRCLVYGYDPTRYKVKSMTDRDASDPCINFFNKFMEQWGRIKFECNGRKCCPDVLVVDSLNVVSDPERQFNIIESIIRFQDARPRILVVAIDTHTTNEPPRRSEFVADAIFSFGAKAGYEDYFQRHFEIVKIRSQSHAWGEHALKIYSGRGTSQISTNIARAFEAPYIKQGGIYVFPSIHWHLSRFKLRPESGDPRNENLGLYPTPLHELNALLAMDPKKQGFPQAHTTAFIGRRGAMKSHLAYYYMLSHAFGFAIKKPARTIPATSLERPKNILLISLRNDIESAIDTLAEILKQQKDIVPETLGMSPRAAVEYLLKTDRLEIIYNSPGCVAPAEFFHRIFVALKRPRHNPNDDCLLSAPEHSRAEIVVLSDLDHIEAKLPLCAREKVFIPGLVAMFNAFRVCSIIVSTEDTDSPDQTVNIQSMADLTLAFGPIDAKIEQKVRDSRRFESSALPPIIDQMCRISALRVPAGQLGGGTGVLARDARGKLHFCSI